MADLDKMDRIYVCSVVFMDIVKYSLRSVAVKMRWKKRFNGYLAEAIQGIPENERVILDTGDGAIICFLLGAPEAAMFAALQLCRSFVLDEQEQQPGLRVRLGINLGPVQLIKDVNGNLNGLGDGIDDGQRIMSFASENKILVSQSFFKIVSCLSDDYKPLFQLKGVETDKNGREHTVYHLVPPGSEKQQGSAASAVTSAISEARAVKSERWQQIEALYRAARDPAKRVTVLAQAEPKIRGEVEALLAQEATGSTQTQLGAGALLGPYKIEALLGAGGMGEVFRATDTRLHRTVAVKILPRDKVADPGRKRRFLVEARATSALNHPNIVTLYDIARDSGVDYLVMEYVPGKSLDKLITPTGLPQAEALAYAQQIAAALAAAHAAGIMHRDIKPANVIVTSESQVKVLDFGLAKLVERAPSPESDTQTQESPLTEAGTVMGTVAYMSPEQASARRLDHRTDIFSLGVVLYEMLAGQRPFRGNSKVETMHAIIHDPAPPLTMVLPRVAEILDKALEKDPKERYQSAGDLAVDLRRLREHTVYHLVPPGSEKQQDSAASAATTERVSAISAVDPLPSINPLTLDVATSKHKPWRRTVLVALAIALCIFASALYLTNYKTVGAINSIAVLPITNSGSDPNLEYMSDGITESLINGLSGIRTLKVMSRSAVFRFRGSKSSPLEQGKALQVNAILTGTMRNISGQIEVEVELVEVNTGRQLWGELYRQPASDLLRLQQSVIEAIAAQLRVQLDAQEKRRFAKDYTANVDAYRPYLKGRYEWNKRSMVGYQKAADYFRQAIDQDPTYALAYSGLADANSYQVGLRMADEIFPAARTAARKAIELDSSLAEGHASLGFILLHYDWDWVGAERELRIALELNPNYASAHSTYGRLLSATARFQEAEAEILKAQQLDPLSLAIANGLALHYYYSRRYNLAEKQFRRNLSIDPASTHTMSLLAYNYLQQNRLPDAIHQYEQLLANDPDDLDTIPDLARAYASAGRKSDSLYLLARLQKMAKKRVDVLPTFFAEVYAALGELDKTFEYLDEAYRERTWQLIFLRVDPVWDPLRGDTRFKQLLGKMGL